MRAPEFVKAAAVVLSLTPALAGCGDSYQEKNKTYDISKNEIVACLQTPTRECIQRVAFFRSLDDVISDACRKSDDNDCDYTMKKKILRPETQHWWNSSYDDVINQARKKANTPYAFISAAKDAVRYRDKTKAANIAQIAELVAVEANQSGQYYPGMIHWDETGQRGPFKKLDPSQSSITYYAQDVIANGFCKESNPDKKEIENIIALVKRVTVDIGGYEPYMKWDCKEQTGPFQIMNPQSLSYRVRAEAEKECSQGDRACVADASIEKIQVQFSNACHQGLGQRELSNIVYARDGIVRYYPDKLSGAMEIVFGGRVNVNETKWICDNKMGEYYGGGGGSVRSFFGPFPINRDKQLEKNEK